MLPDHLNPFCPFFFRATLWHVEVPRLGAELELQLPAYATATAVPNLRLSSQERWILNRLREARF